MPGMSASRAARHRKRCLRSACTAVAVAAPATTHGAPTTIGSIHSCAASTRLRPARDLIPWCVNSLRTPVSVI